MKILRVNMSDLTTSFEELPEAWLCLGGRGLSAKILRAEMPPAADPLGPEARFIVAGGPLAGTLAPSFGRLSVGAKSPLTGGIKETNAGGPAAQKLDRLGIRAMVVQGAAARGGLYLLRIDKDGARLESAEAYRGMKNYALAEALYKTVDKGATILSVGPAGERRSKNSSVASTDLDGYPSRHAGRGGLGAVMAAKGLKAVIIDDRQAPAIEYADRDVFRAALKPWAEVLAADPRIQSMSKYGTTAGILVMRKMGSAPSKNYSSEQTEGYKNLSGPAFDEANRARGGGIHGCMPGCLVRCSVVYMDKEGKHLTSALEYETIALLGTNLGIADPDAVARFDRIADDLGMDTIELGSALGVAASAGKMTFGDVDSALALLDEVERGTEFGRILADGVVATCKALGVTRIPAFKGQAIPAHDPRATKATGVTYATSPMGADHTAGVSYDEPLSKTGQVRRSQRMQVWIAAIDSLGYCLLAQPGDGKALRTVIKELIKGRYGIAFEDKDLFQIGTDTIKDELAFNKGTSFLTANEPDPEFLRTEPLAPAGHVFDVDPEEIAAIWDDLGVV